jgi:hypothetical protein
LTQLIDGLGGLGHGRAQGLPGRRWGTGIEEPGEGAAQALELSADPFELRQPLAFGV